MAFAAMSMEIFGRVLGGSAMDTMACIFLNQPKASGLAKFGCPKSVAMSVLEERDVIACS